MPDPRRSRLKKILGIAGSLAVAALAGYVLYRTFQRISFADVVAHMRATSPGVLLLAAACAAGAFSVLAAYEVAVVRYVKHCIGRAKPVMTALIAFPLGHAVGQAVLSGSALRYRMYAPAGFSAMEVGATVLLCGLPYALAFGLPCLVDEESSAGACGDWCVAPRAEAAFESGRALAHSLLPMVGLSSPAVLR